MANQEQLEILKQGVEVWNEWRKQDAHIDVDLSEADLSQLFLSEANLEKANLMNTTLNGAILSGANLGEANLCGAKLIKAFLRGTNLNHADLSRSIITNADLIEAQLRDTICTLTNFRETDLGQVDLSHSDLTEANFSMADLLLANLRDACLKNANLNNADLSYSDLTGANLSRANLVGANIQAANLWEANFVGANLSKARANATIFGNSDLSQAMGLEDIIHNGPSTIGTDTFTLSKAKIPDTFLRGCGLSDWEVEVVKLYSPDLDNEEINNIHYKMYDLRAAQALQLSPLFVSYSHANHGFVDKLGECLTEKGIRYWRDIHHATAGKLEKQIDRAMRLNPTVLLVLSEHSLSSDWVEYEVRTARELEKELGRDTLCPIALDNSWKDSPWPKRVMEQVLEYNILDFSEWEDDVKFEGMFRRLIDGLELFYKG